ncbi:MAG: tRNA (guanine(46)-N(7))-methyltransferase TrmB [Proteobacteria bacterium]|nr:tRNA (guanine(46)-N(7))-methyltransferase TrmB [Pseudomonadota bacterium]
MTGEKQHEGPQFYGRRHGHKLRPNRQALINDLLPRLRVSLPAGGQPLDLAATFAAPVSDLWLEVGFGGGEHLAAQAAVHPDIGFIGCEPFVNGVANLLSLIECGGLTNVRIFDDDVRKLFPVLADACFGRIVALFTDPWPKKKHHRRRFISDDTVAQLVRLLKDNGEIRLASDHMGYVDWMLDHLTARDELTWRARSKHDWSAPPSDWVETRYERKARAKGNHPAYLCLSRRPRPPA